MAFDSTIRLRQLNQGEVSGYIVQIIQNYLSNPSSFLASTGSLTGSFYPLQQNPSGYEISGAFISQQDLDSAITQALSYVSQNYYTDNNPSGYITGINTGLFYPLGFNPSGYITTGQTGNFGGGGNTGVLTGIFYPLNSNPSGYITTGNITINQSGSYIFSTLINSGIDNQFITFPYSLGNNPYVLCSLSNPSGSENIIVQPSGITSSGYYAEFSNIIDSNNYLLTTFASLSTQTGLAVTVIIQSGSSANTGSFVTTGQTGSFITTGQTGNFGGGSFNTGTLVGTFYLNSNPSGYITGVNTGSFITTSQTGAFYPFGFNPSGYITGVNTGSFITSSQTGAFYPLGYNPSGYVTTGQTGNFSLNSQVVHITGNEKISGVKIFQGPIVPGYISGANSIFDSGSLIVGANSPYGDFVQFTDTFDATTISSGNYLNSGTSIENGALFFNNDNAIISQQAYRRSNSFTLTADVIPTGGYPDETNIYIGLYSGQSLYHAGNPEIHAINFNGYSSSIYILETGASYGPFLSWAYNTYYRIRICVTNTGASYYISYDGGHTWTLIYNGNSNNTTTSPFYFGVFFGNSSNNLAVDNLSISNGYDVLTDAQFCDGNFTIGRGSLFVGGSGNFTNGLLVSGDSVVIGGPYYPNSNPASYITTGQTGNFLTASSVAYRAAQVKISGGFSESVSQDTTINFSSNLPSSGYAVLITPIWDINGYSAAATTVVKNALQTISGFTVTSYTPNSGIPYSIYYMAQLFN